MRVQSHVQAGTERAQNAYFVRCDRGTVTGGN